MKKGDKKKNVVDYLGKIINSLKYRERSGYGTEPESEDYEFEEPSIIDANVDPFAFNIPKNLPLY